MNYSRKIIGTGESLHTRRNKMRMGLRMGLSTPAQRGGGIDIYDIPIKAIGTVGQSFVLRSSANTTITIEMVSGTDINFYDDANYNTGATKTKTILGGATDRTFYIKGSGNDLAKLRIAAGMSLLTKIAWTQVTDGITPTGWTGALPTSLTYLLLNGANINWTYTGALPTSLTYLVLNGDNINWTYTGALPTSLTYLVLSGANVNWTGLDVSGTANITVFNLSNFVTTAMTGAQLIALLTSMAERVGNLPATCTIADYANASGDPTHASPNTTAITAATADQNGNNAEKIKYWITQVWLKQSGTPWRVVLMSVNYDKS